MSGLPESNNSEYASAFSRLADVLCRDVRLDAGFQELSGVLKQLIPLDRVSITFADGEKMKVLQCIPPLTPDYPPTWPLKDTATGWIKKNQAALIEPDLARQRMFPIDEAKFRDGLRSAIHIPLFFEENACANLNVYSKQPEVYGDKEKRLLEGLAEVISPAVRNAWLYRREYDRKLELEQQDKERLEFIAIISHELKTPLTSIIASGGLLNEEIPGEENEPQRMLIKNIMHSAHTLESRLTELSDIVKIDRGALHLQPQPFNIKSFLQGVSWQVGPEIKTKNQKLTLELADDLPTIEAVPKRIEQVVLNLLNNASKFTQEGGSLVLGARKENSDIIVTVKDSGIGIPKEEQPKLFQPYSRIEFDRKRYPGLGLGLFLAKRIVEMHSGRIWVESDVGKGSTFAFSLPLKSKENEIK